jgi:ABC-type glycerol-3-phosphate transport system substrate-binding protein
MRKLKTIAAVATIALSGAVAASQATAAGDAETTVTIKGAGTGDPYGKVKSSKKKCLEDRHVKVYKVKGGDVGGGDDKYTGVSDQASYVGNGKATWFVGQPNLDGKHYARAPHIPGCEADNSKAIDL